MQVDIVERPGRHLAAIRHIGPYREIGRAFGQMSAIAGGAGLLQRPGAEMLAVYYDDPTTTPAASLRSDAAVTLPDGVRGARWLDRMRIAGRAVCARDPRRRLRRSPPGVAGAARLGARQR